MRVHHLDCGSMRAITRADGSGEPARTVCHCLLLETDAGLVLVDSGIGLGDTELGARSLGAEFTAFVRPVLDPEQTALRQVTRLGFAPADVTHIVLTHLHRDHTGGLPDFPHATVHLHAEELRAVRDPAARHHRRSLDAFMATHRAHGPRWAPATPDTTWLGLPAARLPVHDVLLIPLTGHTPGHSGVAVRTADGWLLHAGDAYFYGEELTADPPVPHPLFEQIQLSAQVDERQRLGSRDTLRTLYREHADELTITSAHDPWEFARAV